MIFGIKDDPVHTKAMLLGADRFAVYEHIKRVKGMTVFLLPGEKPSKVTNRAAKTTEQALQNLIEYIQR